MIRGTTTTRWALRFARLLATCLVLILARPATAVTFDVVDRIVLVAGEETAPASPRTTDAARGVSIALAVPSSINDGEPDELVALLSPRALLFDKYARFCSLLC